MKKKKVLLRWVIFLSALYTLGHLLFGFDETRLMRVITSSIEGALFLSILLYMNLKEQKTTEQKDVRKKLFIFIRWFLYLTVGIFLCDYLLGVPKLGFSNIIVFCLGVSLIFAFTDLGGPDLTRSKK